ncbi:organic solute transporter Ostalpha-domain-containing protein [Xylaria sp. FL1042]|nr:organic solute transporter Ostalpha-domain-containing protein [Xylaria sp. FL1042]
MGLFNATCPLPKDEIEGGPAEQPIVGNITFQNLLFYISLAFTGITVLSCLSIAITHLCCYVRPREQRQVLRILFYPVVLAVTSSFSILNYTAYLYLWPAAGLYEPISLAAIFFLFVEFAAPDASTREQYFNELEAKRQKGGRFELKKAWTLVPGGSLRWYQSKYVGLYLYFIATIIIKIVEEITQAAGRYCQYSFSPAFAHIWVLVISNVALPVGVIAIIQFYTRMTEEPHFKARHPTAKIVSFKAVVLLTFVQDIIFDILVSTHAFKNTDTVRVKDFSIGLESLLVCIEQCAVSIWFHWTFSAKEYRQIQLETAAEKTSVPRAVLDALNCTDLFAGAIYAVRLLVAGVGPKGNGSWKRSAKAYEPMKAPSNVRLHGVTSYQGSSSSEMDDLEFGNKYNQRSYETDLRPDDAEYLSAPAHGYNPSAYPSSDRSRSPSPYGDARNPHGGASSYESHSYQGWAELEDQPLQVPASSLGRPQDRDQFHNRGVGP